MVFLFPGFLFRRSFFTGKLNRRFESGNTLERVLWNILFSLFSILAYCIFVYLLIKIQFKPIYNIHSLSSKTYIDIFTSLYENKYPEIFKSETALFSILQTLFSLYIFSGISGYVIHKIIFILSLEKRFSILKFQNPWDYLLASNKKNNSTHSIGDFYYTKVDIKTKSEELFTGKLHQIIYDEEGKTEAIAIQNCYKFYRIKSDSPNYELIKNQLTEDNNDPNFILHSEQNNTLTYRKRIKGNIFTVLNPEIENISITYIKVSDIKDIYQKFINISISLILLTITILCIINGIWDLHLYPFASIYRRIGFSIITPFVAIFTIILISQILDFKNYKTEKHKSEIKDSLFITLISLIPYLYVFNYIRFGLLIPITIFSIFLLGTFTSKKTLKSEPDNEEEQIGEK